MRPRLPHLLALAFAAAVAVGAARPAPASSYGDRARGEAIFFEHAFGANAASVPLKFFEGLEASDAGFSKAALERRFGLLFKEGRELPVGFVKAEAWGMERLSFNCSLCHTGLVEGRIVPGLPNRNLRMQEFEEAVMATLKQPNFTADSVLPAIRARHPGLSWAEEAELRLWVYLAKQRAEAYVPSPHRGGPGRFDLLATFKQRLHLRPHTFNAEMDIAGLFGQRTIHRYPRDGALGGDQDLVRYLIVRLAGDDTPLVNGQYPDWVKDLNSYLYSLEPPRYPGPIDVAKARRGRVVFKNTCSPCHGTYGLFDEHHPNRIIPIGVVGTDANRIRVWDQEAIAYVKNDPLMKKLDLQPGVGFMPPSLRGVWATSPYLHNGSVPTIYDVLSPPDGRPKSFYRGGDGFDPVKVGLSTIDAPDGPRQFHYDTTIPGNGNQGHPFGVPLSEAERWDVIEYLKTL